MSNTNLQHLNCLTEKYKRTSIIEVYRAFFMKEYKIWIGYGTLILLDFMQMIQPVVIYYFISIMLNQQGFGIDYFSFVTIGVAFSHFVYEIMMSLDWNVRREQGWGTIQSIYSTPVTPLTYALGTYSCYFAYSWFYVFVMLFLSWMFMGIHLILTIRTILIAILAIMLMVTSHLGLGFCTVGGNMVSKKFAPVATAFSWIQDVFSGKFFSVAILTFPLSILSYILPLRYSLDVLRAVLLEDLPFTDPKVYVNLIILVSISVVLLPVGYIIINRSFRKAIKKGML